MGSPASGIATEILIQNLEQSLLKRAPESIIPDSSTMFFIIFNQNIITPELLLEQFNEQHKISQSTINEENKYCGM
jgi:hypothetical protein